jgi:hypothetical protein
MAGNAMGVDGLGFLREQNMATGGEHIFKSILENKGRKSHAEIGVCSN